jgi:hypothetical protein
MDNALKNIGNALLVAVAADTRAQVRKQPRALGDVAVAASKAMLVPGQTAYTGRAQAGPVKSAKVPTAKIEMEKKRKRNGFSERVFRMGGESIVLGPLDWASVLAVCESKLPKAVVGTWSFGREAASDLLRVRNLNTTVVGEISCSAVRKLA